MTLYCRECGAELELVVFPDRPDRTFTHATVPCRGCGAIHRQLPGEPWDSFVGWLMFPPESLAA